MYIDVSISSGLLLCHRLRLSVYWMGTEKQARQLPIAASRPETRFKTTKKCESIFTLVIKNPTAAAWDFKILPSKQKLHKEGNITKHTATKQQQVDVLEKRRRVICSVSTYKIRVSHV